MNDVAKFYALSIEIESLEAVKKDAEARLKELYPSFIAICPHSQAADWRYGSSGTFRVCKICGVTDMASEGGTPGDEYNYGYPGSPNRNFWKDSVVEKVGSEKEHWKYRYAHSHGYRVRDGQVVP